MVEAFANEVTPERFCESLRFGYKEVCGLLKKERRETYCTKVTHNFPVWKRLALL